MKPSKPSKADLKKLREIREFLGEFNETLNEYIELAPKLPFESLQAFLKNIRKATEPMYDDLALCPHKLPILSNCEPCNEQILKDTKAMSEGKL